VFAGKALEPFRDRAVCFKWRQRYSAKAAFAVDEDTFVVAEIAEFVRFDFVFLGFGMIDVALAGAEAP
jgi:hypothetical protein